MIGKGEKSSFYFDDICFFAFGVFFVLTCASLFLTLFFMELQGGSSEASVWRIASTAETGRRGEDALCFWGIIYCANVNFKDETYEVVGEEGDSSFDVSSGFKYKYTTVYVKRAEELK